MAGLKRAARALGAWLRRGYWLLASPPSRLPEPTESERMAAFHRRLEGFVQRERPIMDHRKRRPT